MKVPGNQREDRERGSHVPAVVGRSWFQILLISAVGLIVYSNTFQSSFHFDDETSIVNNPAIRDLSDLKTVFYYSVSRFITYLSFALNYRIGGLDVIPYHVFNLSFHILSALAVWLLVRQLLKTPAVQKMEFSRLRWLMPLTAAMLFVVHPVQTQAVTYIAQRAAVLATLFYLLSILCYGKARSLQIGGSKGATVVPYFLCAVIAGFAALFSKETALSLPGAVLLYEFFFFHRPGKGQSSRWVAVPAILAGIAFIGIPAFFAARGLIATQVAGALPASEYLLTQPRVYLTYLRLLVLPVSQNLDYDFEVLRTLVDIRFLGSSLLLTLIGAVAFKLFRAHRLASFGFVWFFLTLLPESSFIPLPDVIFEHRLYLPLFGFALVVAYGIQRLGLRWRPSTIVLLLAAYVVSLGVTTVMRNSVWRSDLSLWSDVTQKSPRKARGYLNLGRAYADAGSLGLAYDNFKRVLELDPNNADAHGNLASIFVQQKQFDAAIIECDRALQLGGGLPYQLARIFFNKGTAYLMKDRLDSAFANFNRAIEHDPLHDAAFYNRGFLQSRRGNLTRALEDYSRAISLNPRNSKALNNRGVLLKDQGQLTEALTDLSRAVALDPGFSQARFNRASVYALRGQLDDAIADFTQLIRLQPNNPEAYHGRGLMRTRKSEYDSAISDLSRAIQISPTLGQAYVDRARVLVAMNRVDEADSDLRQAQALGLRVDPTLVHAAKKR